MQLVSIDVTLGQVHQLKHSLLTVMNVMMVRNLQGAAG